MNFMKKIRHIIPKVYNQPDVVVIYWLNWEIVIPKL